MKYQVLARQYRPKNFSTMVGQEHVLKALANALESERLHHAYLFTGTRGVGKTTVARVFAKALNCEQGITANPCGTCAACVEIDEGRFIDLIEVDAASRTKVEDTRDLLDNVQYAPTRGRFKIYLIDEVHMLSGHSFNALLKTLEEPPPHVKFLLATTDPQKLPVTILSRCLQFNLKSLTIEQIEQQLSLILNTEKIPFENNILKPLAIAADGSMRDGLSLLDQAIAYCDAKPNLADIEVMLGSVQKQRIFELLTALANEDGSSLISQSRILVEQGIDVKIVLAELISTLQRIALYQQVPDAIDDSLGDKNALEIISAAISAEDIQLYYQIALNGRKDLPFSPQPQGGFEMILLRMLAFKPAIVQGNQKQLQEKIKVPETSTIELPKERAEVNSIVENSSVETDVVASRVAEKEPSTEEIDPKLSTNPDQSPVQNHSQNPNSMPQDLDLPPLEAYSQENHFESAEAMPEGHLEQDYLPYAQNTGQLDGVKKKSSINELSDNSYSSKPEVEPATVVEKTSEPELISEPEVQQSHTSRPSSEKNIKLEQTPAQNVPCVDEKSNNLATYWYDLIERSQVDGLVQQLAKHCALVRQSEQENIQVFELLLESVHKHLVNDKMKKRLQEALYETLGAEIRLDIKECQLQKSEQLQTPRRREIQDAEMLQQDAIKSIYADERVDMLLSAFSAQIREETIKPLDKQHTLH